jgi:Protein of unknown function (DUF3102)
MSAAVAKAPSLSELASDINRNHELALMYVGQSFDHAVKAGLLLIEAKAQFPHGGWLKWLKANVKIGVRQAQNYMKVATTPDEKRNAVAHLSMRKAIHALALQKVVKESDSAEPKPDDDDHQIVTVHGDFDDLDDGADDAVEHGIDGDAVCPENYVSAFQFRATAAAGLAQLCAEFWSRRMALGKRQTKKHKDDTKVMVDLAYAAMKAWEKTLYDMGVALPLMRDDPSEPASTLPRLAQKHARRCRRHSA